MRSLFAKRPFNEVELTMNISRDYWQALAGAVAVFALVGVISIALGAHTWIGGSVISGVATYMMLAPKKVKS
jgi:hypothetical protein